MSLPDESQGFALIEAEARLQLICPHCKGIGLGHIHDGELVYTTIDEKRVIEIDPEAKYIVILPEGVKPEEACELTNVIQDWWEDKNMPFLLVLPTIRLAFIRVDE